jgi:Na+/H+ antiporter NhaD/arsenite permease-like protein
MHGLSDSAPTLFGVPVAFLRLGATLVSVLILHHRSLQLALGGLILIVVVRFGFTDLDVRTLLREEWSKVVNLFALLVGFPLLADHFERSNATALLPRYLPRGAWGCFALLVFVWLLSGLVDNIAAAMIGGTLASGVFRKNVHLGYLAAIVGAANAGGAGSVLGDTTTTMMWIEGVSTLAVLPAYVGAGTALLVFGFVAARQQQALCPLQPPSGGDVVVDRTRLVIVGVTLLAVILTNAIVSRARPALGEAFPLLGGALWLALLVGSLARPVHWKLVPDTAKNGVFLVALVLAASLMPVHSLPAASPRATFAMGLVSAVFDNIPLTKLALKQGGYDWALLAYSVGFGGSMIWFGSSAGVAITGLFPEAKSAARWVRAAWHVPLAFVAGFLALYAVRGWNP